MKKCDMRLPNGRCPDGECIPNDDQRCCLDCEISGCEHRCDQSKEKEIE